MNECVLICDDDIDILEVTKIILQMKGYRVETLSNSDELFKKIEQIKPDIILMDLWIPEIGGEKAIMKLKENKQTQDIPVIIFSANNDISVIAEKVGAQGYLCKPFEIKDLEEIIEKNIIAG
jgi:CheY-like chemotaxis protein